MKSKKIFLTVLTALTVCAFSFCMLTACGNKKPHEVYRTYDFAVPDGITVAICADMWDEYIASLNGADIQLKCSVTSEANISSKFASGTEFITAPVNVGANIHNAAKAGKTAYDYKLMNVTSWGVLYFVTTESEYEPYAAGNAMSFLSQFDGKTVETIGRAAIPGKSTEYLFGEASANVTLDGTDAATVQAKIARGDQITAVFAEPAITALKNSGKEFTVLGSVSDIYTEVTGNEFPMAGLFVRSDVYESNKALVDVVNYCVEKSVKAYCDDIDAIGQKAESIPNCTVKAAALKNAKDRINVKYKNAADSKAAVQALLGNIGVAAEADLFIG